MSLSVIRLQQRLIAALPALILLFVTPVVVLGIVCLVKPGMPIVNPPRWYVDEAILGLKGKKMISLGQKFTQLRDPFLRQGRIKTSVPEPLPELKLTMIVINKRHKFCRLNGKLYGEGEQGPGFQVKTIEDQRVMVEINGRGKWLYLSKKI